LPAGDPRPPAAARQFSREQRAALVREYREAVTDGRAQAWLAEKNLTKTRMTRWQSTLGLARQPTARSTQHPAMPGGSGGPGAETEMFLNPVDDVSPLLAAAEHGATSSTVSGNLRPFDDFGPADDLA
jgi:hypothetical protein